MQASADEQSKPMPAGNSYVAGYFYSSATFGTHTVTGPSGTYDIFIAKYDSNGNCLWATSVNGSQDEDDVYDIALDANDNIYITGNYSGTATFGSYTLNSGGTGYTGCNFYVAKYNSSGVCQWVKDGGGNHQDIGYGVDVDTSGNVYATGIL